MSGNNSNNQNSNVVINNSALELNQQLDDHFKKSIEHLASSGGQQHRQASAWREKQLPKSFFEPSPRSVNHSRDGSTDSSGRFTQSPPVSVVSLTGGGPGGGGCGPMGAAGVVHNRAHSSPATLTPAQLSLPPSGAHHHHHQGHKRSLGAAGPHPGSMPHHPGAGLPPIGVHQRFFSCDASNIDSTTIGAPPMDDLGGPLPPGWEKVYHCETGQQWFINYAEKRALLDDPRKCLSANQLHMASLNLDAQFLGPLPPGWEEAYTPEGHKYFINHTKQCTTWYDPRLPEEVQRRAIIQQLQINPQAAGGIVGSMQIAATGGVPGNSAPKNIIAQGTYANQQQQQLQMSMHQASASAPSASMIGRSMLGGGGANAKNMHGNLGGAPAGTGGTFSPNSQKRVQDLSRECRSYRQRQEEIMKQGLLMDSVSPAGANPMSPTQGMDTCSPVYAAAANQQQQQPPQHQQMTTGDFHFRQESSDSGVGGMSTFGGGPCSHPHTPDNFLNTDFPSLNIAGIDLNFGVGLPMEMDATDEIPQLNPNELDQILNCRSSVRH